MVSNLPPPALTPDRRVLALLDLTGFTQLCGQRGDLETVHLLHEFYCLAHQFLSEAGAEVVKFMGDGCLAVAPPEQCQAVVAAIQVLAGEVRSLGTRWETSLDLGANIHLTTVIAASIGPPDQAQPDVFGVGVNHTFLMGKGRGIRLSEPVYRSLASARRSVWRKQKPTVLYHWKG